MYIDSHWMVSVIYEQGDTIGKISNTMQISSKEIKIMSITIGGLEKKLHNLEK